MSSDPPDQSVDRALTKLFYHVETVRLVDWERFSGVKFTVGMVAGVTVIAFVTGLSTLSQERLVLRGPVAAMLPQIAPVVRSGGVVFGFVLGLIVIGLDRRKRIAWLSALIALPVLFLLPLASLQSTHVPLLGAIALTYPLLLANRSHFTAPMELSPLQVASLGAAVGVLAYGTIGSFAIRAQFTGLETWSDAAYYVLVTIATVGYGDITPVTTEAKWFSLSVIVFGTGAFTVAVGSLIVPAIEKRMASAVGNIKPSELSLMEEHVLVLGYSDITTPLIHSLAEEVDLVVVTPDADVVSTLDDQDINVITGDPTDESVLADAGLEYARGVVVGTRDDANDVLAVLATRTLNPDVRIVAAANEPRNAEKLTEVGADEVISPADLGGKLLGLAILEERGLQELRERITGGTDDE